MAIYASFVFCMSGCCPASTCSFGEKRQSLPWRVVQTRVCATIFSMTVVILIVSWRNILIANWRSDMSLRGCQRHGEQHYNGQEEISGSGLVVPPYFSVIGLLGMGNAARRWLSLWGHSMRGNSSTNSRDHLLLHFLPTCYWINAHGRAHIQ